MPRAPKNAATAVAVPVTTPAAAVAPAKPPAAKKQKTAASAAATAAVVASAATPAPQQDVVMATTDGGASAASSKKAKRKYILNVASVQNVNGPVFDANAYVNRGDKKNRISLNFTGHGPMQAAKKAFTQIRKFVKTEKCSYRFSVVDAAGKASEYLFHCHERDLSNPEEKKKHTIVKTGKDGSKTEFVDRWVITVESSSVKARKNAAAAGASTSTPLAPVVASGSTPAPTPVATPTPAAPAPAAKKGGKKA